MTRVQADIIPAVCDWLAARIPEAVVRLSVPAGWKPTDGPLLIVADDGGSASMPIMSRHTIRITGWGVGRTEARRYVTQAMGLLVKGRPPGVRNVDREMNAILDARDRSTGAWLASVLISLVARTVEL